jgi:homoserine/homoserine lactone efflux protein
MRFDTWITCFIASVILSLSPGAGAIFAMTSGLNFGLKRGLYGIIGLLLGMWTVFIVAVIGLGALTKSSLIAFNLLKWGGVIYLAYLGLARFKSHQQKLEFRHDDKIESSGIKLIVQGWAVNAVNPKGYIFMVAVIPQFVEYTRPLLIQYGIIIGTMTFNDAVIMTIYAGLAAKLTHFFSTDKQMDLINKTFGVLFILAALGLSVFSKTH